MKCNLKKNEMQFERAKSQEKKELIFKKRKLKKVTIKLGLYSRIEIYPHKQGALNVTTVGFHAQLFKKPELLSQQTLRKLTESSKH